VSQDLFSGERLYLRAFESEDVSALHTYLNHDLLRGRRYIPRSISNDLPLSVAQVEAVIEQLSKAEKQFHLAVVATGIDKVIGHVNCDWGWDPHCPHISLIIAPDYQRQGYGTEVLNLLLSYLYEHTQAHSVGGGMAEWNLAAREFSKKHGFKESGKMRRVGLRKGEYYDWIGVDILRPEWQALKGALSWLCKGRT